MRAQWLRGCAGGIASTLDPACVRSVLLRVSIMRSLCSLLAVLAWVHMAHAQAVPPKVQLSPAVRAALQSPALTDQERAALRLRHGTWDDGDLTTPAERARAALAVADFDSPALADPAAPAAVRAEALIASGRPQDALA